MAEIQMSTTIRIPRLPGVEKGGCIVFIGSCFAAAMGHNLLQADEDVVVNPLGTLFNPLSIANAIRTALREEEPRTSSFVQRDEKWVSFDCHSDVCGDTKSELKQQIEKGLTALREGIREAKMLVVTFGTALLFERQEEVVANCHKRPAYEFEERLAPINEIVAQWHDVLHMIRDANSAIETVLTVSPVRHILSGVHRNALSKALLLKSVMRLTEEEPQCHYFPAFEIVLDELRDYRFYRNDLAHPAPLTISLVAQRFWNAIGRIGEPPMQEECNQSQQFSPLLSPPKLTTAVQTPRLPRLEVSRAVRCIGGTFAQALTSLLSQCGLYATYESYAQANIAHEGNAYSILCVETDGSDTISCTLAASVDVLLVSPIRQAATPHASSALAHAAALLKAQQLLTPLHCPAYFPAYEILHDELRDYRFYASDLLSPSPLAIRIIASRLVKAITSAEGLQTLQRYETLLRTLSHRPSNPQAPAYLALLKNLREEANSIAPLLHPAVRTKMAF